VNTTAVALEGRVEAHAMPEDTGCALTVRIGGDDVLAVLCEAGLGMESPVTASVTIDTDAPVTGQLRISRGYAPGCDTCYEGAAFEVGDRNVLNMLNARGGEHVALNVTLAGHVPPPPVIVPVELAHHYSHDGARYKPLDVIEVEESYAHAMSRNGLVTRECAERLGLPIAPVPPEFEVAR
jgi:hypothetical protein